MGSGGVSTVFKAKQIVDGSLVALKILHAVENNNDQFKQRFLDSVKALSKISQNGMVKVVQFGESEDGFAYAAMQLASGICLRKRLKEQERLPALKAAAVARDAANILESVHEKGFLHRDIKSDNIIFTNAPAPDTVALVDPAFAYMTEADNFAREGTLIGSPRYISPEQGSGKPSDARSDVYSLCVCFYEMLTGEKPYSGNTSAAVLYKQMNDPIPQIKSGEIDRFSPTVNDVLNKGMAKDPAARYDSMKLFANDLDKLISELENIKPTAVVKKEPEAETAKKSGSKLVALVAGIVVVALASTAAAWLLKPPQAQKANAEFDKIQNEHKKKTIAFLQADVRQLEKRKATRLHDPEYLRNLASQLRKLAEAQRNAGDITGSQNSALEAISLFDNDKSGNNAILIKLYAELALDKIQAKDYTFAQEIIAKAEALKGPPDGTAAAADAASGHSVGASLLPARLQLNIHLHKFAEATKDLEAVFTLSHKLSKDDTDAPLAVATTKDAYEAVASEHLSSPEEKAAALAFIDTIIEKFLENDKDMAKAPCKMAADLLPSIPANAPGMSELTERTQRLISQGAKSK